MASTPQWKVYRDGNYVAACKDAEDAAALTALWSGGVVKYDHKQVVWTEGAEEFSAGESYDRAGQIMRDRREQYRLAASARREASIRSLSEQLAPPKSITR